MHMTGDIYCIVNDLLIVDIYAALVILGMFAKYLLGISVGHQQ